MDEFSPLTPPEGLFSPLTAREALLAIRLIIKRDEGHVSGYPSHLETMRAIERLTQSGLDRGGPSNYELSDQLADRLAQAHKVLAEVRAGTEMAILSGEIDQALSLPPDLEAMVERRIR